MGKIITILLPNLRAGGAEKINVNLANYLCKQGFGVHMVLLAAEGDFLEDLDENILVVDLAVIRIRNSILGISKYLIKYKPDVLLACMWPLSILGVISKYIAFSKTKIFIAEHTTWGSALSSNSFFSKSLIRCSMYIFFNLAERVIVVSQNSKLDVIKFSRIKENKVSVIYNPITTLDENNYFDTNIVDLGGRWSEGNCYRLISVGSLKPVKDYMTLLKAISIVLKSENVRLLMVGEGGERFKLTEYAKKLGIEDYVDFSGYIKNVTPYYQLSDLHVLSSITEGLPTVIIEALDAGVPTVSTDCPSGPREILGEASRGLGLLSPVGNEHELASNIIHALNTKFDRNKLISRAKDFSIETASNKYIDIFFDGIIQIGDDGGK